MLGKLPDKQPLNPMVFFVSATIITIVALAAIFAPQVVNDAFGTAVTWTSRWFGSFYILLITAALVFILALAFSRFGRVRLGPDNSTPDFSTFSWTAMLFAAGIGTEILFFAVAEPVDQYMHPPTGAGQTTEAARTAASQAASQVAETYATKASLSEYLPKTEAAGVYATKSDLANAQLGGKGEAPDLSHLATKVEMASANTALGQRIDQVKAVADAAAPQSALASYVTSTDAQTTYETKADAAQSKQELSTRVDSLSTTVSGAATKSELSAYLTAASAQSTYATKSEVEAAKPDLTPYATKESLDGYLTKTDAESTYAKAADFRQHVADADGKFVTRNELTETYSTKQELRTYASQAASSFAPASLSGEVAAIKETADAALPKDVAATTYATKDELTKAQLAGDGKIPDLSGYVKTAQLGDYARKTDLDSYAKTTALSAVSTKADAALPKTEAAATYATIASLTEAKRVADAALPKTEAAATYTTKTDFEAFKKHFTATALGIQGSGWAVLAYDSVAGGLVIFQLFDQQGNVPVGTIPLFQVDMWEHAFYLDYLNVKADYVKAIWNIANWQDVSERLAAAVARTESLIVR